MSSLIPRKPTTVGRDPYKIIIVLTGLPKVGKSTLALQDPSKTTVLLATEEGYRSINGVLPVPINSWAQFLQVLDEMTIRQDIQRIVIDTYGKLAKMARLHVCEMLKIKHPSDAGFAKGWDLLDSVFFDGMLKLKTLNRQIVMICHTKDSEEVLNGRTISRKKIEASGAASRWLDQECHSKVYYEMVTHPATGKERRLLWFKGRDDVELGGRYLEGVQIPTNIEIPTAEPGRPLKPGWPLVQQVLQKCFVPSNVVETKSEVSEEAKSEKRTVTTVA